MTLKRRTPLKTKPKRKTAEARRYHEYIAGLPCLVCGGQATVHHVSSSIHGRRFARNDMLVAPLCPTHHLIQHGPRESVEALGHRGFYEAYGIDLEQEAAKLAVEWLL